MTMRSCTSGALKLYSHAESYVRAAGFAWEIDWQRQRLECEFNEQDLLRESAWVVLCSGFRETVVRNCFDYVSLCFCDWESSAEISNRRRVCVEAAASGFGNLRKLNAIATIADIVHESGFSAFKRSLANDPIQRLQALPFIGPITSWHLAKNLGFNVAKNDRHLARLAEGHGFSDAQTLCGAISKETGEVAGVIDIVLWRFAVLTSHRGFSSGWPNAQVPA